MDYRDNQFQHVRFQRVDPTGRWSPIQGEKEDPLWMIVVGVMLFVVVCTTMVMLAY